MLLFELYVYNYTDYKEDNSVFPKKRGFVPKVLCMTVKLLYTEQ